LDEKINLFHNEKNEECFEILKSTVVEDKVFEKIEPIKEGRLILECWDD
jgi:hypothetical protein